jgi:hypothetical protein
VHRQALTVATAGLAALTLSGCATFTDNAAAARVGDAELSYDDVLDILSDTEEGAGDAEAVRGVTSLFVANELVKADLEALGAEPAEFDSSGLPMGDALQAEFTGVVQTWQALPVESLADAGVDGFYTSGVSGIVCTAHVLTETEAEAEAVIGELEAGRSFAEVAEEVSTDPGSGVNGGRLGCQTIDDFETTFVPEFVEGARTLQITEVSGPVESEFGFHVITKVEFDQLGAQDVLQLRVRQFDERYDIYIDPSIGTWTATADIIPLG